MIFTLAKETGWHEKTLLWEIPLARLLQYYHAAMRSHDLWTVAPGDRKAPELGECRVSFTGFDILGDDEE
jgi:hypothetical protein